MCGGRLGAGVADLDSLVLDVFPPFVDDLDLVILFVVFCLQNFFFGVEVADSDSRFNG